MNHYSGVGYCQGMNYVAGLIILVLRDEEKSFWLLVCLLNEILPESKDSKCSRNFYFTFDWKKIRQSEDSI